MHILPPEKDRYARVVQNIEDMMLCHKEHPEVEVVFLPKYKPLPYALVGIIDKLDESKIDFNFSIFHQNGTDNFRYFIDGYPRASSDEWCRQVGKTVCRSSNEAHFFTFWLLRELTALALLTTEEGEWGEASFSTSRYKHNLYPDVFKFHIDDKKYEGQKFYTRFSGVYAQHDAVTLDMNNIFFPHVSDAYLLYQLRTRGMIIQKGLLCKEDIDKHGFSTHKAYEGSNGIFSSFGTLPFSEIPP